VTKRTECDTMKILIKAMQPHRQRILTADGEEIRLQRWANRKANRDMGTERGTVGGAERFTQARDKLMYDAVANPEEHGIKFLNERVPFEGQNLESSLSDPMSASDIADITDTSSAETERAMGGTPNLFDSEGKLRDGMPPEEEEFKPDAEAEHMKRIMTSRQVPMRDAWSILKFGYPSVAGAGIPEEVRARHNISSTEQQPYDSEGRYLEHQDINVCPEAKAYLASGQRMDKDPNFCNNCDFCHGK
jgi:hypothetical protein